MSARRRRIAGAALLAGLITALASFSAAEERAFVLIERDALVTSKTPVSDVRARIHADHEFLATSERPEIVRWRAAIADLGNLDPWLQLREVNRRSNARIAYTEDWDGYGESDFWATPSETLARGTGDCEDIAFLKIVSLRHLGWAVRDVALTVGWLKRGEDRVGHAMAVVRVGDTVVLLDNLSDTIGPVADRADFTPVYAASADASWLVTDQRPQE